MNRGKRTLSLLLAIAVLLCSIPFVIWAETIPLTVATWEGMQLSDIVLQLNKNAGLKADNNAWTYQTKGTYQYTYTKIEANAGDVMPGMGWMDATAYLPQYPDLQAEAEKQLTAKEKADSEKSEAYVPLSGKVEKISSFVYTLPNKVQYMGYSAGARATLKGELSYPALNPAALPKSVMMKNDGVQYAVSFVPAREVSLVQQNAGGTYQIGAAGVNPDYVALTVSAVIDMESSSFGDGAIDTNAFVVELYEEANGTYRLITDVPPVLGASYRVRITYQGIIFSDSLEVQVVYTDNRAIVHAAFTEGTLDVMYGDSATIGEQVFDKLLKLSDSTLSLSASDMDFEYFAQFDYSSLLSSAIGETLKAQIREKIGEAYDSGAITAVEGLDREMLVSTVLNDFWLQSALKFSAWVPFEGGSYSLSATVGGQTIKLGEIALPAIGVGNYRIRAKMNGTALVFPFEAESREAVLTVHPALAEISIGNDGVTSPAAVTALSVDVASGNLMMTLPETLALFKLTVGGGTVDAGELLLSYLRQSKTLGQWVSVYREQVMPNALLANALVGDTAVMEYLFRSYFGGAMAAKPLTYGEPTQGNYLVLASIGDRNYHAAIELGLRSVGEAGDALCYLTLSGGTMQISANQPTAQGQHMALRFKAGAVSMTNANVDVKQTVLKPDLPSVYVYDGMPHGAPILMNGTQELSPAASDVVLYINTQTGKLSKVAPSEAGTYLVRVFYRGTTTELISYTFRIETAKVSVTLPNIEMTYGEVLGDITPSFGEGAPAVLPQYEIEIVGYKGDAGTYPIRLTILGANPGYEYVVTEGKLTVKKLALSIKVDDQSLTYGDALSLTYTVTEGAIPSGFTLPLTFSETPKNAGSYEITASCADSNVELTVKAGKIKIAKKKLTLQINTQTLLFGQVPEYTTTPAWTDPDVQILYELEGYNNKPGTYYVDASLSDDTNYDVTFKKGKVTFEKITALVIRADSVTAEWGEKPNLTATAYAFKAPNMIEVPTVGLSYTFTVKDANGNVVDLNKTLEIGVYDVTVEAHGDGVSAYSSIRYSGGSLTVVKKQVKVGVQDCEIVYGDQSYKAEDYAIPVTLPEGMTVVYNTPAYKNAGSYAVTVTVSGSYDSEHYEVKKQDGVLTVLPKPIVVTPDVGQYKVKGSADPMLTWTADGLLAGDALTGALTRAAGEEPGTYAIRIGTLSNPNYTITLTPATFTLLPAGVSAIRLEALPYKQEYLFGEEPELTGLRVMLVYENGDTAELDRSQYRVEGFDASIPGVQTLTVVYGPHTASFTVTVLGGEITFNDERFTVDGDYLIINSVTQSVKLTDLLDALGSGMTALLYKNGKEQTSSTRVATNMTIQICMGDVVLQTLTIRVVGDVNGDGRLTQTDAMMVLQYVVGKAELNENAVLAADVISLGRVTQTDAMQILRWVLNFDRG